MEDLIRWLRAQLDEDDASCRREIDGDVHEGPCLNYEGQDPEGYDEYDGCALHVSAYRPFLGDPRRGLAEVESKRRILDELERWRHRVVDDCWYTCPAATEERDGGDSCNVEDGTACDCGHDRRRKVILTAFATPYADRSGYRDEWRP